MTTLKGQATSNSNSKGMQAKNQKQPNTTMDIRLIAKRP